MKTNPIHALTLLCLISIFSPGETVVADGPPMNRETREVLVPHTLIDLTSSQVEELETMETITFPPEQWVELRKVAPSCPKRLIEIIPWNLEDCTCTLSNYTYGIVISPTEVAVVHGKWSAYWLACELSDVEEFGIRELRIDRSGRLYLEGSRISKALLLASFQEMNLAKLKQKNEGDPPFLAIRLPFGMTREDAAVQATIDDVYEAAESVGWETMNKYRH